MEENNKLIELLTNHFIDTKNKVNEIFNELKKTNSKIHNKQKKILINKIDDLLLENINEIKKSSHIIKYTLSDVKYISNNRINNNIHLPYPAFDYLENKNTNTLKILISDIHIKICYFVNCFELIYTGLKPLLGILFTFDSYIDYYDFMILFEYLSRTNDSITIVSKSYTLFDSIICHESDLLQSLDINILNAKNMSKNICDILDKYTSNIQIHNIDDICKILIKFRNKNIKLSYCDSSLYKSTFNNLQTQSSMILLHTLKCVVSNEIHLNRILSFNNLRNLYLTIDINLKQFKFIDLEHIEILQIKHSSINYLTIKNLKKLKHLELTYISFVNIALLDLIALETLVISESYVEFIHLAFKIFNNIKHTIYMENISDVIKLVNLSHNLLSSIPFYSDNLETLNLSHNRIENLNHSINHMFPNIKNLDLSFNKINNIAIKKTKYLECLNLENNQIKINNYLNSNIKILNIVPELDDKIRYYQNLIPSFNSVNQLSTFHNSNIDLIYKSFPNLKILNLRNRNINSRLFNLYKSFPNLKILNLQNRNINSMLFNLHISSNSTLEELTISEYSCKNITIEKLSRLQKLSINSINTFDEILIKDLPNLLRCDLDDIKTNYLNLVNLPNVKYIYFNDVSFANNINLQSFHSIFVKENNKVKIFTNSDCNSKTLFITKEKEKSKYIFSVNN